jgi:hypothetical protein
VNILGSLDILADDPEIAMMAFTMQILSGQSLVGQGVQFLQQAGISTDLSFSLAMVLNSMFIIGTATSWVLMSFFGRRTLYTGGMACMCITLYIIGGLGFNATTEVKLVMGSLLIVLNFIYNCTIGPATYTIIGESIRKDLVARSADLQVRSRLLGSGKRPSSWPVSRIRLSTSWRES